MPWAWFGGMGMGGHGWYGRRMGGGMGGFGGSSTQGGGFFGVPEQLNAPEPAVLGQAGVQGGQIQVPPRIQHGLDGISLDDLIETISTTIAPESWDEVGW